MDGTIVDTEPYWIAAETALVTEFGGTWDHGDALSLVGRPLEFSARVLQERGVALSIEEIVQELTGRVLAQIEDAVPWRPGAPELLAALKENGTPSALVTMSIRRMAERIADALPFRPFDVIVAGDEVTNGKPHPEAYLRGAELLGVAADECVAIEDSAPGMASAAASGAVVIGVPFHVDVPAGVDHVRWSGLADRTIGDLFEAYREGKNR
jgi:HAD superfamily hydrolase (TIGR01509 family)